MREEVELPQSVWKDNINLFPIVIEAFTKKNVEIVIRGTSLVAVKGTLRTVKRNNKALLFVWEYTHPFEFIIDAVNNINKFFKVK